METGKAGQLSGPAPTPRLYRRAGTPTKDTLSLLPLSVGDPRP